MELPHQLNQSW